MTRSQRFVGEDQPAIVETRGGSLVADPEPLPSDVSPHRLRRGLLRLGGLVAIAVVVVTLAPGLGELRSRFAHARPVWIVIACAFELRDRRDRARARRSAGPLRLPRPQRDRSRPALPRDRTMDSCGPGHRRVRAAPPAAKAGDRGNQTMQPWRHDRDRRPRHRDLRSCASLVMNERPTTRVPPRNRARLPSQRASSRRSSRRISASAQRGLERALRELRPRLHT
jgi:hypothetical protein